MNARLLKEFRPLLFPGGVIALCAALTLTEGLAADAHDYDPIRGVVSLLTGLAQFAFFIGIALVAAISFGSEFQQRTFVILLSQPIERFRIWRDKMLALTAVLGAIGLVHYLTISTTNFFSQTGSPSRWSFIAFVLIVLCSTAFWTLTARSTIGGVAFALTGIFVVASTTWFIVDKICGPIMPTREKLHVFNGVVAVVGVLYSIICLWLGWRKFARMELRDSSAGEDIVVPQRFLIPKWIASLLRCRPNEAVGNLIRKELRLQKPVFLIATIFTASWIVMLGLLIVQPSRQSMFETIFNVLTAFYIPLLPLLAGCITHGEENTLGINSWHLTLPPSARKQWLIKLLVSLMMVLLLGFVLPFLLAALTLVKAKVGLIHMTSITAFSVVVVPLFTVTVVSFWAGTLTGTAVRAALMTVLICAALGILASVAQWLARSAGGLQTEALVRLTFHYKWSPGALVPFTSYLVLCLVLAVLLLMSLRQSFHNFRRIQPFQTFPLKQPLVLLTSVFLVMFAAADFGVSANNSYVLVRTEVPRAIEALGLPDSEFPPFQERRQITLSELEKDKPLPPKIHAWLSNTKIELYQATSRGKEVLYRHAFVHFSNGDVESFFPINSIPLQTEKPKKKQ